MREPISNPALLDAITCARRELGDAGAVELLAEAALESTQYATEDPAVAPELSRDDATYRMWWAIWQRLALIAPESFQLAPAAVSSGSSHVLAYLHARRRYADSLPLLEMTAVENTECVRARELLRRWTGVRTLKANDIRVVGQECLPVRHFDTWQNNADITGWALGAEPMCPDQVVFLDSAIDAYRAGEFDANLIGAVTHEEMHNALNAAAGAPGSRLGFLADELTVEVCELAVGCIREGRLCWNALAHAANAHRDRMPLLRVLALLRADGTPEELLRPLIRARLKAGRDACDQRAASALNAALGCERSAGRWVRTLAPDEV